MTERKDIESRLINWGLCQRGKGGGSMACRETRRESRGGGGGCMTDVVCTMLRNAANGPPGGAYTQSGLDFSDAATINDAWQRVDMRSRMLLRDLYAQGRPVNTICRELNIKHWPASHWKRELQAAQDAIADKMQPETRKLLTA